MQMSHAAKHRPEDIKMYNNILNITENRVLISLSKDFVCPVDTFKKPEFIIDPESGII